MTQLRNPHPGEILKEEFLNELDMSQNQLAHSDAKCKTGDVVTQ
jgi:plasmid maintenance system antidote protein VapI